MSSADVTNVPERRKQGRMVRGVHAGPPITPARARLGLWKKIASFKLPI
jgi:hypothetical protein